MLSPTSQLNLTSQIYPQAWKQVELMRQDRGKDIPNWPAWCFLPIAGFISIASNGSQLQDINSTQIGAAAQLAAIGTWRYSQGIYQFEKEIYESLITTKINGDIPAEVLYRLQEWCVYIETDKESGFWAHLEYDINTKRTELRFLVNENDDLTTYILHVGEWSVSEGIEKFLVEAGEQRNKAGIKKAIIIDASELHKKIKQMLSLVLYLCSDEPDYPPDQGYPQRPKPKKTKKGWRLFAPSKPRIWKIGEKISEQIRSLDQGGTHKGPIPHLRRAHWHGFWTGPRDGQRKFKYKFLPPISVNADD